DFQAERLGPYEQRAIRKAAAQRADLIVWTGDYLQERLEPTYPQAAADFRALLQREHLDAPLGSFAVGGDADGDWKSLFRGLPVQCLENSAARVELPGGKSLAITGLLLGTSRTRDAARLKRLVATAPAAD